MKRKFLNILVIFFIVFISMFASKSVYAADDECTYISPMTFIDTQSAYFRNVLISLDSKKYYVPVRTIFQIKVSCEKMDDTNDIACKMTYIATKYDIENVQAIPLTFESKSVDRVNINYYNLPVNCSQKYMVVSYDELNSLDYYYKTSNNIQSEYVNFLNNQYKGMTSASKFLAPLTKPTIDSLQIQKYIDEFGPVVLINTKYSEKYEGTNYKKFVDEGNARVKDKSEQEKKKWEDSLSKFPIDQNDYNTRSITKDYYNTTKQAWASYYKKYKDKDEGSSTLNISHQLMANWFYYVGRYILEENITTFEDYFTYLFKGYIDDETFDSYIGALRQIESYKDADDKESCFESDDPCVSLCTTQAENGSGKCSGQAWDACTKGVPYNTCENAYKSCKEANDCSKYSNNGNSYSACMSNYNSRIDSCMENKLGKDEYQKIKERTEKQKENIQKQKDDAFDKFIYNLSKISAPTLDINFEHHYKLTCDDVSFFHGFYVVIRILAPIAVVLFGTLDYAKAVLSADIDKLNKSKKSLPKRILLLILFLGVPLIVSFMVNLFGGDYSLMKCIINGE